MYGLDFVHYDLGYLVEGTTVVVSLDVTANVCVLDSANFMYYKMDISFMHLGGYITRSPYYVVIPRGGFWHVAIDLGGYEGCIGSSVEIISPEKIEVGLTFMGYPAKKYPNKKSPTNLPTTYSVVPTAYQMDLDIAMRSFKIQVGILCF